MTFTTGDIVGIITGITSGVVTSAITLWKLSTKVEVLISEVSNLKDSNKELKLDIREMRSDLSLIKTMVQNISLELNKQHSSK